MTVLWPLIILCTYSKQLEEATGVRFTVDGVAEACSIPISRDCAVSLCNDCIHIVNK